MVVQLFVPKDILMVRIAVTILKCLLMEMLFFGHLIPMEIETTIMDTQVNITEQIMKLEFIQ